MSIAILKISNCLDCPHHKVIDDGDPHDSFCSDDVAVLCTLTHKKPDNSSFYRSDQAEFRSITSSCRPYQIKKESVVPNWCPLIEK